MPTFYWGTERERSPQMLTGWAWKEMNRSSVWISRLIDLSSMYCSEEIFALLVREQLRLAVQMGFRLIALITGHAAKNQIAVLQRLAVEFSAESPSRVTGFTIRDQLGRYHGSRARLARRDGNHASPLPRCGADRELAGSPEPLRNVDWAVVDYLTFLGNPTPERTIHEYDDRVLQCRQDG